MSNLEDGFEVVRAVWQRAKWPGVEEGLSWGTVALKVRGKMLIRLKEPDVAVLLCDSDEKAFLMQTAPDVYFQTDHYSGYPAVLARLSNVDPDELSRLIEKAWKEKASKKMLEDFRR
ncbi:MmcQ/YjbR family DNA-binding protein [Fimbriimonas ginsengisoli]|uniref:MmcQ/YjbR family DNA-binding protein n=1 Tax=Fimbriimonas ginsengisoli Gsoil 348 TaxID=661478 RepID=A0A068NWG3_FIMGI|nr:MmcQ/YjbR family DNA-binding protein [Fimbriimonas ginsengisoli]AIE87085.1 hypothetical protein OP10G_3717 [Fimbriimonas ginsengisoli Gsoil 348]